MGSGSRRDLGVEICWERVGMTTGLDGVGAGAEHSRRGLPGGGVVFLAMAVLDVFEASFSALVRGEGDRRTGEGPRVY